MNDFLESIKTDLLDTRRRPLLIGVVLVLVGAIAYAALAGGSPSSTPVGPAGAEPTLNISGVRPSQAQPGTNQAVAETTSGVAQQHGGSSRDPFTLLPGATKATTTSATSSTSTSTSSPGTATGSTETRGGTKPTTHAKSRTVYSVAVLFGKAKAHTPANEANLTPYENLKQNQLIPSPNQPLIAFRGVIIGGESAAFTLVGEEAPILRGLGACRPSATECHTLDVKVGQTEELEYLPLTGGEAVTYELQVASIVVVTTMKTSGAAARVPAGESKQGAELLRRLGMMRMPGMRYSARRGVLVFTVAHAHSHMHAFAQRAR